MSQYSETKFKKSVIAVLRKHNAIVVGIEGGNVMQRTGLPDTFVAHRYWHGWLEFKSANGKLKEHQRMFLKQMQERGVPAFVCREPQVVEMLDGCRAIIESYAGVRLLVCSDLGSLLRELAQIDVMCAMHREYVARLRNLGILE